MKHQESDSIRQSPVVSESIRQYPAEFGSIGQYPAVSVSILQYLAVSCSMLGWWGISKIKICTPNDSACTSLRPIDKAYLCISSVLPHSDHLEILA